MKKKPKKAARKPARKAAPKAKAAKKVPAIPPGYHSLTPFLTLRNTAKAIEFYKKAFGAKERSRMPGPGGSVMHAELVIGDSSIMMGDEMPQMGSKSPETLGGSAAGLMIYTTNVDALFAKATAAGATVEMPPMDMFWGDRYARLVDPFGHKWAIGTHIEDVSPKEMNKRAAAELAKWSASDAPKP
jgi:PhnB protein